MRRLVDAVKVDRPRNEAPVPLVGRRTMSLGSALHSAGTSVDAQLAAAEADPTLGAVVSRRADALARVRWHLYRKAVSGKVEDRQEVPEHLALKLWNRPNSHVTGMAFRETLGLQLALAGRGYGVISRFRKDPTPLELWNVTPARMVPVPHPTKFLAGWVYLGPDGEEIPLRVDEVLEFKRPHPSNPYGALSPTRGLMNTVAMRRAADQYNLAFFNNSARPDGVIEVPEGLTDRQFENLTKRWEQQHRGVSRAHRVALIEHGKWINTGLSQKDMEFVELHRMSRDDILEAHGFPRTMLGITDDVNRANAEAGEYIFSKWLTLTDLERLRDVLNAFFLPLFATGDGLEFDFDSPVERAAEDLDRERDSKSTAFATLKNAGVHPDDAADVVGLPKMRMVQAAPDPVVPTPFEDVMNALTGGGQRPAIRARAVRVSRTRNADEDDDVPAPPDGVPAQDVEAVEAISLAALAAAWSELLTGLLAAWSGTIVVDWIAQLVEQVREIVRGGWKASDFYGMTVDTASAVDTVTDTLVQAARSGADAIVEEADAQDVELDPYVPTRATLEETADGLVRGMADGLRLSAADEAARVATPTSTADEVADAVAEHLESLTHARAEKSLRGAVTGAQNEGRKATLLRAPEGAIYATEILDEATCGPCRRIHGRWIANTSDMVTLNKLYPGVGGYVNCEGGYNCRGTVTGVWRPQQVEGRSGDE